MLPVIRNLSESLIGLRVKQSDVDAGIALVLAAAVTGAFGLLTVVVSQFRKENRRDHDVVMGMLKYMNKGINRAEIKLDKVSEKLSDHIENHPK